MTDPRLRNTCRVHPLHRAALVGEAPGPNTRSDFPMYPYPPRSAAGRLAEVGGFTIREYLLTFARANLLQKWPGKVFPFRRARQEVQRVVLEMAGKPILMMGRGVASAFGFPTVPPLRWEGVILDEGPPVRVAMVPHPSGRNLWYNDPDNREAVRAFLAQFRAEDA